MSGPTSQPRSTTSRAGDGLEGVVIVDKPGGWTSHDVVSRIRRLAGTRRVGHAGTLDPLATGVLVVGIGRATRMLGYIGGTDKTYTATMRLGWATDTDDAEGARIPSASSTDPTPEHLDQAAIRSAVAALTGSISQRPSAVSAIKVRGRRSHERVRSGEQVQLEQRPVVVSQFQVVDLRRLPEHGCIDLDVIVSCSSGTYVRALARDLGAAMGVGGHLTALRRTRVGTFGLDRARTLEQLAQEMPLIAMPEAARACFASVVLTDADANAVRHGRPVQLAAAWTSAQHPVEDRGAEGTAAPAVYALFATDGQFLALARPAPDGSSRYLAVFAQP